MFFSRLSTKAERGVNKIAVTPQDLNIILVGRDNEFQKDHGYRNKILVLGRNRGLIDYQPKFHIFLKNTFIMCRSPRA